MSTLPTLFDGVTFDRVLDTERLAAQTFRVLGVMKDGQWRTLREIAFATGDGEASVSARLRDLRKPKFGGWRVDRQRRAEAERGIFEYRVRAGGGA